VMYPLKEKWVQPKQSPDRYQALGAFII
jgi:hypothetical protein